MSMACKHQKKSHKLRILQMSCGLRRYYVVGRLLSILARVTLKALHSGDGCEPHSLRHVARDAQVSQTQIMIERNRTAESGSNTSSTRSLLALSTVYPPRRDGAFAGSASKIAKPETSNVVVYETDGRDNRSERLRCFSAVLLPIIVALSAAFISERVR